MPRWRRELSRKSNELELYELVEMIKELTAEKQNIYDYLDLFTMWFRDVLLFKATKEVDGLIFKDQYNYIKERAKKSSYEGIENIIDAIGKARERLHSNVNFDLVMELLFMKSWRQPAVWNTAQWYWVRKK